MWYEFCVANYALEKPTVINKLTLILCKPSQIEVAHGLQK